MTDLFSTCVCFCTPQRAVRRGRATRSSCLPLRQEPFASPPVWGTQGDVPAQAVWLLPPHKWLAGCQETRIWEKLHWQAWGRNAGCYLCCLRSWRCREPQAAVHPHPTVPHGALSSGQTPQTPRPAPQKAWPLTPQPPQPPHRDAGQQPPKPPATHRQKTCSHRPRDTGSLRIPALRAEERKRH